MLFKVLMHLCLSLVRYCDYSWHFVYEEVQMSSDKCLVWYNRNIDSFSFKKFTILPRKQNKEMGNNDKFGVLIGSEYIQGRRGI